MDKLQVNITELPIFRFRKKHSCGSGFIESGSRYGSGSRTVNESGSGYGSTVLMTKNLRKQYSLKFFKLFFGLKLQFAYP
jgi:hypothetical protein